MRVTHPFHPLLGRAFELKALRQTWGEDRVFFYDDGRLRGLPATWTDAVAPPVFVTLAAGRAHFRPDDLLRLVELVDGGGPRVATGARAASDPGSCSKDASTKLRRICKTKDAAGRKAPSELNPKTSDRERNRSRSRRSKAKRRKAKKS